MFWAFLGVLVVAEAAKLNNAYLPPPPGAKESGGSDGALQVPLEPPYVDRYSPNSLDQQAWRPGTRAVDKPVLVKPEEETYLENEDEITVPALQKGRFISGSYSYTGPDNVLVTVTYKANEKKARKDDSENTESEEQVEKEEVAEEEAGKGLAEEDEEDETEDSVVPTPPTLPSELARAFDFHKKKNIQPEEDLPKGKTNRPKKPIRKTHTKKGPHGHIKGDDGEYQHPSAGTRVPLPSGTAPGAPKPGYHYNNPPAPEGLYSTPTIHQGYSYPKQS